ncbi:putative polyamine oxidase 5, partial [Cucurbita argyrosperma subsp. argyrosperma]
MVERKAKIVIIGAGMAGLTAANSLYTAPGSADLFDISVVEGGGRIGGRINTVEFMGQKIEMGATWIHGIRGSPIHEIADQINALHSDQPWEFMNGWSAHSTTVAEGGVEISPAIIDPVSSLFTNLIESSRLERNKNPLAPTTNDGEELKSINKSPCLNFVFHRPDSEFRRKKIPWWIRKTSFLRPIYQNSSILLSWFAGEEALHLEKLNEEEVINGVSTTISNFQIPNSESDCNDCEANSKGSVKFSEVLKSQWGSDPLFQGSYSYIAVGSSGEDLDAMAEPLPRTEESPKAPLLQILFAGEATHRTHYSTTHGAYFSGLREANRLLHHYNCI